MSKLRWFLNLRLELFTAYRNYVRPRFNRELEPPAQRLGFIDRPLTPSRLLSWRQDWARRSVHPLARAAESVEEWTAALGGCVSH